MTLISHLFQEMPSVFCWSSQKLTASLSMKRMPGWYISTRRLVSPSTRNLNRNKFVEIMHRFRSSGRLPTDERKWFSSHREKKKLSWDIWKNSTQQTSVLFFSNTVNELDSLIYTWTKVVKYYQTILKHQLKLQENLHCKSWLAWNQHLWLWPL